MATNSAVPRVSAAPAGAPAAAAGAGAGAAAAPRVDAKASVDGQQNAFPPIEPLIVSQQPQNALAYTNHVFVSPTLVTAFPKGTATGVTNFVLLKGFVFIIQPHEAMRAGAIGLNKLQRESLSLSDGDTVNISVWVPPTEATFNLHAVRIEFETYGAGFNKLSFKEDDMLPGLKQQYAGQVIAKGQQFWGKFGNLTLMYKVTSLEAPTKEEKTVKQKGHITKPVGLGMLTPATKVKLAVKAGKEKQIVLEESDERPPIFDPDWSFSDMGIGGLDAEFGVLFRRAFASRLFPPAVIEQLGIKHVKGMLLYGPPGTGKTLIARQIGKLLKGREPKVVNGPEILNKYVGQSEENIRLLFKEAEEEQKSKGDKSSLHIIIFDEIDAICKQRGTQSGSTGVHDTVVNQLLSKIDGVNSLNNILVIGMTNRKDMIDAALLRPGRLEVHIEIGLPDAKGREQILNIHTKKMRENKKLADDVDLPKLSEATKNFSGAELEGLVKSASSFALYSSVDVSSKVDVKVNPEDIIVTMAHFERALMEVTPAFGVADDELKTMIRGELLDYSPDFERLKKIGFTWVSQVRNSKQTPLLSVLLEGDVGSGKTALAGKLALDSDFPYTKVISPEMYVGFSENAKCAAINKIFEDAYKSPLSLIILDNIERLLEYVPIGPRFSNQVLQTLLVLIKRIPPNAPDRRLMVLATTSSLSILKDMEFKQTFNVIAHVPSLTKPEHVVRVFQQSNVKIDEKEMTAIAQHTPLPMGIKQLLMLIEMAGSGQTGQNMSASRFLECVHDSGLDQRRKKAGATVDLDIDNPTGGL